MTVGLVHGMGFNDLFFEYAEEEDFTYNVFEPYFENVTAAEKALQEGKIDALVYADFRVASNEKIIDMIESHGVFTITRKEGSLNYTENDRRLLKIINTAMDNLDTFEEGWRTNLKQKYFSVKGDNLYLTTKEKEVLKKYSSLGDEKLTIIGSPNMEPYIWFEEENGKYKVRGLYGILFEELIEKAGRAYGGINYEVIVPNTYEEYLEIIDINNPDRPDIILGYEESAVASAQTGYISTAVFDSASASRVYTKNLSSEADTIVRLKSMPFMEPMILNLHQDAKIVVCDTDDEALEMLRAGIVDMFYTLEYSAMQYTYLDQRGLFRQLEIYNSEINFSFGVNNQLPHELVSGLSKYVRAYSASIIDETLESNTYYGFGDSLGFIGLLYNYPVVMISIILSLVIVVFMIVITIILRYNQLKASRLNNLFELSLKITPSGFIQFMMKPNGEYELISVNPAAIKMFGYDDEDDFTNNWFNGVVNSVYYEDRDSIKNIYRILTNENSIIHEDLRVIHKDGTLHILDGECAFIGYENRNKVYLHTFRDSTDEALLLEQREKEMDMMQQLEEALNKAEVANSAKTIFLSNMSHDIRTPLNAIIGFLNILRKKIGDNSQALDTLNKVDAASNNLVEIINNVLDMSRIESGKEVVSNVVFSPVVVRDEISAVYAAQAQQKNILLSTSFNIKYTHYFGDPLSLKKVLMNLISNAIKYTSSGGNIIIEARSLGLNEEGFDRLQFKVADNGAGMSDDFLTKIFVPFEREFNTTQSGIRGTGLGMAIVKQLVELMNGTISVESKRV
jgi:PAS domain S-box-containing protein